MALDQNFLGGVRALTFDCYGTLIDWDGGIEAAMAALSCAERLDLTRLAAERAQAERELQAGPYLPYGQVLARSLEKAAERQGQNLGAADRERFAASMEHWPPFPDSHEALCRLARRFRLAILSNVETAVLRASVRLLDAPFDLLVTAEDVRSYKPRPAHFVEGLQRLELQPHEVLHVAGSLYHDVIAVQALGWRAVWVNRLGEPVPRGVTPDLVVPDMATLADALCGEGHGA